MPQVEQTLLDATDTTRRVLQNGLVLDGILLFVVAGALLSGPDHLSLAGMLVAVCGVVSLVVAFFVKLRWTLAYKGHTIRFENDPFRGERLFIDDDLVAKGGLGVRMVLQDSIKQGAGTGDRITAVSEAGLFRFQVPHHGHAILKLEVVRHAARDVRRRDQPGSLLRSDG